MNGDTAALLAGLTGHGLAAATPPPLPDAPLDVDRWRGLLGAVRAHRLAGPLVVAIDDGALPVTEAQWQDAARLHASAMALTLQLEHELTTIAHELARAAVPFRVLKGPAIAHLDEDDPWARAFGDVDLLVRAADVRAAVACIEGRGGRRRYDEPRPGFDEAFGKGASFTFDRNVEVDLHRTLAPGPYGLLLDLDELFGATEPLPIGDAVLDALDRPGRFLHAAMHAVLGQAEPRLVALRDLVLTAPHDAAERRQALERAHRWGIAPVVARAVEAAAGVLGWRPSPELATWAAHAPVTDRDRRWLAAYAGPQRSSAALSLAALEAVPGRRRQFAYAWALAVPAGTRDLRTLTHRWRAGLRRLGPTRP